MAVTLALFVCWVAQGYAQAPLFAPAPPVVVGPGSGEVFLADINQDGHLDLLTKHLLKQTLSVRSGDGKGHFVPALESSLSFDYQPGAVALGDVNHDGILDVGVASKDGDRETSALLRFADLNRDGKPDIATANGRRNSVEIFLGDGRAGFSSGAIVRLEPGRWFYSFALGDSDGDGRPECPPRVASPVTVRWDEEPGAPPRGVARSIALDLRSLSRGRYVVAIQLSVAGRPHGCSSRELQVVAR